mmetsp:Transcript_15344/g.39506  ORF Transcript_15344/g.39506 Transcript_15344/m.39506 type:complete len:248 (+) Transcript_15344:248-991(+)
MSAVCRLLWEAPPPCASPLVSLIAGVFTQRGQACGTAATGVKTRRQPHQAGAAVNWGMCAQMAVNPSTTRHHHRGRHHHNRRLLRSHRRHHPDCSRHGHRRRRHRQKHCLRQSLRRWRSRRHPRHPRRHRLLLAEGSLAPNGHCRRTCSSCRRRRRHQQHCLHQSHHRQSSRQSSHHLQQRSRRRLRSRGLGWWTHRPPQRSPWRLAWRGLLAGCRWVGWTAASGSGPKCPCWPSRSPRARWSAQWS